jgi:hypothetical protein
MTLQNTYYNLSHVGAENYRKSIYFAQGGYPSLGLQLGTRDNDKVKNNTS